jgi:hydrogenase maturation protein HypF
MLAPGKVPTRGAVRIRVRGVVQGVGFRPFVYRLAQCHGIGGWVLNGDDGVLVVAEGTDDALARFVEEVRMRPPPAAEIASVEVTAVGAVGFGAFEIRESTSGATPTVRIAPDLPVCDECLAELFDPADRRFAYPYITCTNCGPRYSIILGLPYDRPFTTMREWPMCERCAAEYHDPADRRFHAQPVACHDCGPTYVMTQHDGELRGGAAIAAAAAMLRDGAILGVKGIGGYHLACDARNARSVAALRERKYRKERPFALMTRDLATARALADLDGAAEGSLRSRARPIVLAAAREQLDGISPDNRELGVMLPYTPLHHLLFAAGAPGALVMTSANRSSEPIAYDDADALAGLAGIADAFLVGERRIARRIDDSVVRADAAGPVVLRRGRGYAPQAVAVLPATRPILALGGDLKNAIALVVDGQAFVSQHIGDLDHYPARIAFEETIRDLCAMYEVRLDDCLIAHDAHPEYVSSLHANGLGGACVAVQHHRAHVASVLAEREAWDADVVGVAFDGTGYGDDGTIWGGEIFTGSVRAGFTRVAHLRPAPLPGGDSAARFPVQAAAGFLWEAGDLPDLCAPPFDFPPRYSEARRLVASGLRTFATTSIGRLFDTVAALCGFVREVSFEGQAAMWLEHLAAGPGADEVYPFPIVDGMLDYRPLLTRIVRDRANGRDVRAIARGFHRAVAGAVVRLGEPYATRPIVVSGGVFQNRLLVARLRELLGNRLWTNSAVPANDGGLCLGQAGIAAFSPEAMRDQ